MLHTMVRHGDLTVHSERDGRAVPEFHAATDNGCEGSARAGERARIFTREGPADG